MRNDLVKVVCAGQTWWNYYRGFNYNGKDEYESVKSFNDRSEVVAYADSFNEEYEDKNK